MKSIELIKTPNNLSATSMKVPKNGFDISPLDIRLPENPQDEKKMKNINQFFMSNMNTNIDTPIKHNGFNIQFQLSNDKKRNSQFNTNK